VDTATCIRQITQQLQQSGFWTDTIGILDRELNETTFTFFFNLRVVSAIGKNAKPVLPTIRLELNSHVLPSDFGSGCQIGSVASAFNDEPPPDPLHHRSPDPRLQC
jgi:hypothetical protein